MARFIDPQKRDPFRNFNFRVLLGGAEVAAFRKMSGLTASGEVAKLRAGNSLHPTHDLAPGRTHYEPVTLESGLTTDPEFENWATPPIRHDQRTPPQRTTDPEFRREVEIHVYDLDRNRPITKCVLHKAWVSKYTAMSELTAEANEILIETIEIQHEGFTRVEA